MFRWYARGRGIEEAPSVDLGGVPEPLSVRQGLFDQLSHGRGPVEVEVAASHTTDAPFMSPPTTPAHDTTGARGEDDADRSRRTLARDGEDLLARVSERTAGFRGRCMAMADPPPEPIVPHDQLPVSTTSHAVTVATPVAAPSVVGGGALDPTPQVIRGKLTDEGVGGAKRPVPF